MDSSERQEHTSQTQLGLFSSRLSNTENQGYHQSFRLNDSFFRYVVESLEDYAIFTFDNQGIVSSWNRGAENLLGYMEKEIIGKNVDILFTEEDIQANLPLREREQALQEMREQREHQHVKKDGTLAWTVGLIFPLYDDAQNVRGFTALLRDISEQRLANQRLVDAQAYTESIVETIREPILVLSKNSEVITANRSFYQTFDVTDEETIHKSLYELGNGQWNIPALRELLENILPNNSLFENYQVEYDFPKVGKRIMLLNARKLYRAANHTEMILLAFDDVTNRIQLDHLKDNFLRIASHELKTPITSIKAYIQLLLRRFKKQGNTEQTITATLLKVERQLDRLTGLVNDLLDMSRLQTGKFTIREEQFDLTQLVEEVVENVQTITSSHPITFEQKVPVSLLGDRDRIEQVLVNLMTNAIKYSSEQDGIIVSITSDESFAMVSVQDFGSGIDPTQLEKVFEQFYQIKDATANNTGLGLGLYISNEIVKAHNGQMSVQSVVGQGSTFRFSLPLN